MKKLNNILVLSMLCSFSMVGQHIEKKIDDLEGFNDFPNERMYVHLNTSLFFVGEYMYYKTYCFNNTSNRFSDLSKVGYVELVGQDKKMVFKHKLRLDNGLGHGDFFIPETIPSGYYKLLAYTNWMRNNPIPYFQNDIVIINPYQADQNIFLSNTDKKDSTNNNGQLLADKNFNGDYPSSNSVALSLGRTNFNTREKASILIKATDEDAKMGNYSLSVRQISSFENPRKQPSIAFSSQSKRAMVNTSTPNSKIHLPELRGELISGRINPKNDGENIKNVGIALSIPGKNPQLHLVKTNEQGVFYVTLTKKYMGEKAIIQVLGENREDYNISLDEPVPTDYARLDFEMGFRLSPKQKRKIIERSVHNQIENAFFEYKPDSVLIPNLKHQFKKSMITSFDLDDYDRFSSMKDTFIEVISHSWIRPIDRDHEVFKIRLYEKYEDSDEPPLLIIDGVIVQDHNVLMEYNVQNIKRISIVRDRYILGPNSYGGILIFETLNGDYSPRTTADYLKEVGLLVPQPKKRYFNQIHSQESSQASRLPDDRTQLLWVPDIALKEAISTIDFFTSDVVGEFELSFEGFTLNGKPISITKTFDVR